MFQENQHRATFVNPHPLDKILAHRAEVAEKLKALEAELKFIDASIKFGMTTSVVEATNYVVTYTERKGAIDYTKVPELQGVNLEPYRKAAVKVFSIQKKGM